MNSQNFITATNLAFSYDHHPVIADISFNLAQGEILALVGASGCGKSTLLKLIGQMLQPNQGNLQNHSKRYAYVSQEDSLLYWKTVFYNVALPYHLQGEELKIETLKHIDNALAMVGLENFKNFYPHQLSGGMKKRVEIARALSYQPDLLLLDEPFSALDVITRERLNVLCKNLNKTQNLTTVLVTHSMEEAVFLGNQVLLLSQTPATLVTYQKEEKIALPDNSYTLNQNQREQVVQLRNSLSRTKSHRQTPLPLQPKSSSSKKSYLFSSLTLVLLIGILALAKKFLGIADYLLPYPSTVFKVFWATLKSGFILHDLYSTLIVALMGIFITLVLTLPLAYFLSKHPKTKQSLMPLFVIANAVPIVALAPFLILWLGLGLGTKVVVVVLIIFFPLFINAMQAFTVARIKTNIHKTVFKPKGLRLFGLLELPLALPHLFVAVKVALTTSVIGSVVAEFMIGAEGLGSRMTIAKASFNIPLMAVALLWIIILSLTLYGLTTLVEKKLLKHHFYA